MTFWHLSERPLSSGDTIQPGCWGDIILARGDGHVFFFREHLLELWRRTQTTTQVSRLHAAYTYEDRLVADERRHAGHHLYEVEPVNPLAPTHRADMLWLTWMGEPNKTPDNVHYWCRRYWEGGCTEDIAAHATAVWEHLFACPLRVLSVE
jgi:hypothetical protein